MTKEYIERESAEAIFRNARRRMKPEMYKTFDEFNTRDCMLLNAEQLIHLLPAADVAPVVHGRWREMDKGYYVCSSCNTFITVNYGYKYCPNCGAKMDRGQDDA